MTQQDYIDAIRKVSKINKKQEDIVKEPEHERTNKKVKSVSVAIGMAIGIGVVILFDALLVFLVGMVFGVSFTFWQCALVAFAIEYVTSKMK
jgi:hypothetical protein